MMHNEAPLLDDSFDEMEMATAQQLALCCGRDEPNEHDIRHSVELVKKWNAQRSLLGLKAWS